MIDRNLCPRCLAELTSADYEAGKCTQCGMLIIAKGVTTMIANHYVVTGKERKTRFWLKSDGLPTGFRKGARRFLTREQAQIIADKENASGIWRFRWTVTVRQFDPITGEIAGHALEDLQFNERTGG